MQVETFVFQSYTPEYRVHQPEVHEDVVDVGGEPGDDEDDDDGDEEVGGPGHGPGGGGGRGGGGCGEQQASHPVGGGHGGGGGDAGGGPVALPEGQTDHPPGYLKLLIKVQF